MAYTEGSAGSWDWWGTAGGLFGNVGPAPLARKDRATLEAAGYTKDPKKSARWIGPQGEVIKGKQAARRVARGIRSQGGARSPGINPNNPPYVLQTVASVGIPSILVATSAQRAWRAKVSKLKKAKKPKASKWPKAKQAAKVAAKLAERFPRVGRAFRFARGNVALATAYIALEWAWEKGNKWWNERGDLSPVIVSARRVPVPRGVPRQSQSQPSQWPRQVPAPQSYPSRKALPQRAPVARIPSPAALPKAKASGDLSPVVVSARRIPVPATVPWWKSTASYAWKTIGKPYIDSRIATFGQRRPSRGMAPNPFVSPQPFGGAQLSPLTSFQEQPLPLAATSKDRRCKCPPLKKRKRGKRKLRTVCYKGSYTETSRGLSKHRREQIPCRA